MAYLNDTCLFLAYQNTNDVAATGDGTAVTTKFDVSAYNITNSYDTSTYTFTAPKTGFYQFDTTVTVNDASLSCPSLGVQLVTTSQTYDLILYNLIVVESNDGLGAGENATFSATKVAYLMAGETARIVTIGKHAGAKVVDIIGGAGKTTFSGRLL